MGTRFSSVGTIFFTFLLLGIGSYVHFYITPYNVQGSYSVGTMDLAILTNPNSKSMWNEGWLTWDQQNSDKEITKSITFSNEGTLPGYLFLEFSYEPLEYRSAQQILVQQILCNGVDQTFLWIEDYDGEAASLTLYDLAAKQYWKQERLESGENVCYTFIFSNSLENLQQPIALKIIVKGILQSIDFI